MKGLRDKFVIAAASNTDRLLIWKDNNTQRFSFEDLSNEVKSCSTEFTVALFEVKDSTMRKRHCLLCSIGSWVDKTAVGKVNCPYCKRSGEFTSERKGRKKD